MVDESAVLGSGFGHNPSAFIVGYIQKVDMFISCLLFS